MDTNILMLIFLVFGIIIYKIIIHYIDSRLRTVCNVVVPKDWAALEAARILYERNGHCLINDSDMKLYANCVGVRYKILKLYYSGLYASDHDKNLSITISRYIGIADDILSKSKIQKSIPDDSIEKLGCVENEERELQSI